LAGLSAAELGGPAGSLAAGVEDAGAVSLDAPQAKAAHPMSMESEEKISSDLATRIVTSRCRSELALSPSADRMGESAARGVALSV
jgi:hypothetical protein